MAGVRAGAIQFPYARTKTRTHGGQATYSLDMPANGHIRHQRHRCSWLQSQSHAINNLKQSAREVDVGGRLLACIYAANNGLDMCVSSATLDPLPRQSHVIATFRQSPGVARTECTWIGSPCPQPEQGWEACDIGRTLR